MAAVKVWSAALTETVALSPMASFGTRASETEAVIFICSPPVMTARGAELEMKLSFTAVMVARVPEMGAITLPEGSTFSRAVSSWSRPLRAF